MAQQDPDKSTDDAAEKDSTRPGIDAGSLDADSAAQAPPAPDETIFETVEDAQPIDAEDAPTDEPSLQAYEPESAAPEPPPAPRKPGFWRKFMLFLALLGLVATGGGLAAIQFKDKDERLRVVSDFIEGAIKDPKVLFLSLEEKAAKWLADSTPSPKEASRPVEPAPPAQVATSQTAEGELQRLVDRIDRIEESAKAALKAAQDAKSAERPATAQPSPEEGTYLNALEGRIDELAGEIRAVRERLDTPKNETRVAPEPSETQKPAPVKMAGSAADIVVVAQSLAHELERGRPYSAEQAALSNLGADPELLAALAPSAESGAPTAAQLLKSFATAARALRALDGPKTGSSLADQLLQGAAKLVKVRPAHEPAVETIFDIVGKIETALAHDDVGAAADAFARLPDNAKAEAKAFGETLNRRRDAEKAAASLLSGAIAALGRAKN